MSTQKEVREKVLNKEQAMDKMLSAATNVVKQTHNPVFKKTDKERAKLYTAINEHNKRWFLLFGTKRPSAGIVRRHFSSGLN